MCPMNRIMASFMVFQVPRDDIQITGDAKAGKKKRRRVIALTHTSFDGEVVFAAPTEKKKPA